MEISEVEMKKRLFSLLFILVVLFVFVLGISADGTGSRVISLKIEQYPTRTVYSAFDSFDGGGMVISALMEDGSRKVIPLGELTLSYEKDDCFRVGDDHLTLSYGSRSVYLPVTVNPISYPLDSTIRDITLTYNGRQQSYTETLPTIIGLDGIPLRVEASGGGINVGVYEIFIDFSTDSVDYIPPESRVAKMTIEPMVAPVLWRDISFVYDGRSKIPTAEYIDALGNRLALPVLGGATNAGVYTARVSTSDPNYLFTETAIDYEIKKADYDLSRAGWNGTSFIYDGSKRGVTLSGLPKGVSVVGYEGNVASEAGKYSATATLSWDSANYNPPILASHSWEILPAEYDLSGFKFVSSTYTYDGNIHYPSLEGKMPVGADGVTLEYSFSNGATHVSEGKVSVTVSFSTASKNYNTPKPQYSSVSITPLGINVRWSGNRLIYSGEKQAPTATATECGVRVSGDALTVGKYVATAESKNGDYYVINDRYEFEIVKAQNSWKIQPASSTCYEGREIKLVGESKFGEVRYTFYSDSSGATKISAPTSPGTYYARLSVDESMNFSGLTSGLISFEIVKIVPVSFVAELKGADLVAFGTVAKENLICSVVNNDGSGGAVDSALVEIVYANGDSLRKSDEYLTLIYDKFSLMLPIEVGYASYDLGAVRWENTTLTYTGEPLTPTLIGLPDGVTVRSFGTEEMVNAGEYSVVAELSYDSENYSKPILSACKFVIEKKQISIPTVKSVYNGRYQQPTADSLLYTIETKESFRDAGRYAITIRLTDNVNYVFKETGGDRANSLFEITPASLGIKIKALSLHLFERLKDAEYLIEEGRVFADDFVDLEFYLEGGMVYASSKNPNYLLNVSAGELTRLPYPTLLGGFLIFCAVLLLIMLIFVGYLVYKKRGRLATAMGIIKCRIKHRHFKVADPIDEPRVISMQNDGEKSGQKPFRGDGISIPVDEGHADMLITDSQAKSLLRKDGDVIYTDGTEHEKISVGELSDAFVSGDRVDINALKQRGLVSNETGYLRITTGGKIDKPLTVYANEFSLSAVKMIALSGGQAVKCITMKGRTKEKE